MPEDVSRSDNNPQSSRSWNLRVISDLGADGVNGTHGSQSLTVGSSATPLRGCNSNCDSAPEGRHIKAPGESSTPGCVGSERFTAPDVSIDLALDLNTSALPLLTVSTATLPRFDRPPPTVREARLLNDIPWCRTLGKLH